MAALPLCALVPESVNFLFAKLISLSMNILSLLKRLFVYVSYLYGQYIPLTYVYMRSHCVIVMLFSDCKCQGEYSKIGRGKCQTSLGITRIVD